MIEIIIFMLGLCAIIFLLYLMAESFKIDEKERKRSTWINIETGKKFVVENVYSEMKEGTYIPEGFIEIVSIDNLHKYTISETEFLLKYKTLEEYESKKRICSKR